MSECSPAPVIRKSCRFCRSRKIKCTPGDGPDIRGRRKCVGCSIRNTECIYERQEQMGRPRRDTPQRVSKSPDLDSSQDEESLQKPSLPQCSSLSSSPAVSGPANLARMPVREADLLLGLANPKVQPTAEPQPQSQAYEQGYVSSTPSATGPVRPSALRHPSTQYNNSLRRPSQFDQRPPIAPRSGSGPVMTSTSSWKEPTTSSFQQRQKSDYDVPRVSYSQHVRPAPAAPQPADQSSSGIRYLPPPWELTRASRSFTSGPDFGLRLPPIRTSEKDWSK